MLTELDRKLIQAIAEEKTNFEIATKFNISVRGVEQKIKKICKKYGVKGKVGLVREFFKESTS